MTLTKEQWEGKLADLKLIKLKADCDSEELAYTIQCYEQKIKEFD